MRRYNPKVIEPKWQKIWEETGIYRATESGSKPKKYILEYFPYPSGATMHVGHVRNYTIGDAISRFSRMQGFNVLHPMGWDAFGLPAENYAIKNNISPKLSTDKNIETFKKQLMQLGYSYDWSRELNSSSPDYYKWTQWLFLKFYEKGLAYRAKSLQNWCPTDQTVLANEQVIIKDGVNVCERDGTPVIQKEIEQWFLKITDYADRLVDDLDKLDWPEGIKAMQRNWIGRSKGAEVIFQTENGEKIKVFTTRPDTIFGATYLVLAPEHPLVEKIVPSDQRGQVESYVKSSENKTEVDRQEAQKEKTGVFTGAYATNPANDEKIPIWIADYILMNYGSGAIMAVPAHDDRDFDFATKYDLPIKPVVVQDFGDSLPDEEYAKGANVVVYNLETGKYLALDKWANGVGLVSGGINENESFEDCAIRELAEETGIKSVTAMVQLGEPVYSHYYNNLKKVNKRAFGQGFLAVVESSKAGEAHREAHETFEPSWMSMEEIRKGINKLRPVKGAGGVDHWLEMCDRAQDAAKDYLKGEIYRTKPYSGEGILINSGNYDGLSSSEAREKIVADMKAGAEPLFIQTTEPGAVKEGQSFVERQAITAIVKHWSEDKYIGLKWKKVDWETLITGGVEHGQTPKEGAIAEIREETGYLNPKLVKELPKTQAQFFHIPKNENRWAHFHCFYFELENGEHREISESEKKNHEVVWLTKEEMAKFALPESQRYSWDQLFVAENEPVASQTTQYRLRDWSVSRQRYWGSPIPIIYCEKDGIVPVPEQDLPVVLPDNVEFKPTGQSPLKDLPDFVDVKCPKCGEPAKRETDTFDTFVDSSWYYLRFTDPHNTKEAFAKDKVDYWMPVDSYIGGAEHAVVHLLYARFWTKFFKDIGLLSVDEPFLALRNQGMIGGADGRKMGKRYGNVITPDELIDQGYGADSVRLYELFIGPYNMGVDWNPRGISGTYRFLDRFWVLVNEFLESKPETTGHNTNLEVQISRIVHKTIKRVSQDLEKLGFNTAISALMQCVNELYKVKSQHNFGLAYKTWQDALIALSQLLAPFAPHITEEVWAELGQSGSVHVSKWPAWDEALVEDDMMTIAVQINGKVRSKIVVSADESKESIIEMAKADEKVAAYIKGKKVEKEIYVPGRLVSLVVS